MFVAIARFPEVSFERVGPLASVISGSRDQLME